MIKLDVIGIIERGDDAGSQVKVIDDSANTGGFLIITGKDLKNQQLEAFDDWVQNEHELQEFFKQSGWLIRWLS
ncbi:hypothetical protein [Alteromonas sp. 009811495]|uniref:hypothetical protein n=1 Tax=Alteromonas sp. 009811495 TaxID=3002962 RepID=UPI00237DEED3|nr:hypothetical protein [Alteromonas sp. 009811495]WDT86651.1 hypothetical protein OZ660_02570 [Alteromonas sp. 009811495]